MFDDFYEVYIADTLESKEKHFQIRHDVFKNSLSRKKNTVQQTVSNHTEFSSIDEWDKNAVHFIVRDKFSGEFIAAMRLVFHEQGRLPVGDSGTLFQPIPKNELKYSVEVSRLCLLDGVRRKMSGVSQDSQTLTPIKRSDNVISLLSNQKADKSIIWGLFRAAIIYSYEKGISSLYFTTYTSLARLISREGFTMDCIGRGSTNSRGKRLPYKMDIDKIFSQTDNIPSTNMSLRSYFRSYHFYSNSRHHFEKKQDISSFSLTG